MHNLATIAAATRLAARALADQQRQGRKLEELHRQLNHAVELADHAGRTHGPASQRQAQLRIAGIETAIELVTRQRRAAHRRWTNAQAILAANPLPGDAAATER